MAIEVEKIDGIKYVEEYVCEEIPILVKNSKLCVQYAVSYESNQDTIANGYSCPELYLG